MTLILMFVASGIIAAMCDVVFGVRWPMFYYALGAAPYIADVLARS